MLPAAHYRDRQSPSTINAEFEGKTGHGDSEKFWVQHAIPRSLRMSSHQVEKVEAVALRPLPPRRAGGRVV
jgi:hypothetical protein